MDRPGEFVSEPFAFRNGGVLSVEASVLRPADPGPVEYSLDGSEDKTYWAALVAGVVSSGERVETPCGGHKAPWGRIRLRTFGGNARVSVRTFPGRNE